MSRAVAAALAFRSFMTEFSFPQRLPTEIKNDNSGTVAKAASDASDKRSPYMKRRVRFIQEAQRLGEVVVTYVQSAANRADIITKPQSPRRSTTLPVTRSSTCDEQRSIFTALWQAACLSRHREAHVPALGSFVFLTLDSLMLWVTILFVGVVRDTPS